MSAAKGAPPRISHRAFSESPLYCKLDLSPLMGWLFDAAEGVQPLIDDDTCKQYFGCPAAEMPTKARRTVVLRVGGRGGKTSRAIATKAIHAAWTVPLPTIGKGEFAAAIIVAPDLKLAQQALSFIKGYIDDSPILGPAKNGETANMVELRRPDGQLVRIEVLAATRGGRAVRGRTLVFAAMDEACFFFDEDTGIVNDSEIWMALLQRVVPEGQVWIVSTPWIEDVGLLEGLFGKNFGTHENALCMCAGTRALNPNWDPDHTIETDLRAQDPERAMREIDGIPLASGTTTFFDPVAVKNCVDASRLEKIEKVPAGMIVGNGNDLAFEKDCSAHVEIGRTPKPKSDDDVYELLALEEKKPEKGKPLKPKAVIDAFAEIILAYGGDEFPADLHYRMSAKENLEPHKIKFVDAPTGRDGKNECYLLTKKLMNEGRLVIPNIPRLITQLRQVVAKPVTGGGVGGSFVISSPRQKGANRTSHGDVVSALVLGIWHASKYSARARVPPVHGGFTTRAEASSVMSDATMDMVGMGTITD